MAAEKLVVGVTGMPGAGKSLVTEVAQELGYFIVAMGDVVREETCRRKLELTPENVGKVMLDLRRRKGKSAIAKRTILRIIETQENKVLVDGVRSLSEVEEFKKHFRKFSLIAMHASPETRFKRLHNRGRSDDSSSWKVFNQRDKRELSVGLGEVIAMAEDILINEEKKEIVKKNIKRTLEKVEEKWSR